MSDGLHDSIVKLIPSKDLRDSIRENGCCLSDMALLSIVFHFAPDLDSRIRYLRMLEVAFTGGIRDYITRIIQTQQKSLDDFMRYETGTVYELHIKETPDAYEETYLCGTFEAALKMITLFYGEYDGKEDPSSRYRVVKRRVFSAGEGEVFSEDYLGEVALLPGGIIHSVHMDGLDAEGCDGCCWECQRYCVRSPAVSYPCFTSHGDAVKYRQFDGAEHFGIVLQWEDAPTHECYIIPLDYECVRYHDFSNARHGHEHIPAPFVEKISVDSLPDKTREDYLAYREYLRNHSAWA